MRKPEQSLWDTMKNHKPAGVVMRRIENGIGAGDPDVYLRKQDWQTWIELKQGVKPAKMATKMLGNKGLSIEQINWHLQHAAMNLYSYILIRDNTSCLYLFPGSMAEEINDMSVPELFSSAIVKSTHGRNSDTWAAIYAEIAP